MSEKDLRELFQIGRVDRSARGWRCPDDMQLAAYVDDNLPANARHRMEAHFADCKSCVETLACVAAVAGEPTIESVPGQLITRARALAASQPGPVWRWRWALTAVAASLLVVFTFILWKSASQQPPGTLVAEKAEPSRPVTVVSPAVEQTHVENTTPVQKRSAETHAPLLRGTSQWKPTLLAPREGSIIRPGPQVIRWTPVTNADFYEITVVTEDGGSVVSERTNGPEFSMNAESLHGGSKYFVTVVAHLSGHTVRSSPVSFTVARQ